MNTIIRLAKKIKRNLKPKAMVLMYHRIGSPEMDPWDLSVSQQNFEQQLYELANNWKVQPLSKLVDDLRKGHTKNKTVAITFDDGYLDNFETARPLLEKYRLPATFFIPNYNIENETPFWWDLLEEIIFNTPQIPDPFEVPLQNDTIVFSLEDEAVLTDDLKKAYRAWKGSDSTHLKRCQLFLLLWSKIKALAAEDQLKSIQSIASYLKMPNTKGIAVMNKKQLQELAGNHLFTIGAHTAHHAMLAAHTHQYQFQEIEINKHALADLLKVDIDLISYPYGNYNSDTLDIVNRLQFKAAFTTDAKPVSTYSHRFQYGRLQVRNWKQFEFRNQLIQWQKMIL